MYMQKIQKTCSRIFSNSEAVSALKRDVSVRKDSRMNITLMEYYRELKGYTYEEISELTGIPMETIRKIFGGEMEAADYETLQALEKALKPQVYESEVRETSAYQAEKKSYTLEDYYGLPDDRRVELIDGKIYDMAAPTTGHQEVILRVSRQIADYIDSQKGKCRVWIAPVDVRLDRDDKTMVQPDVLIVCDKDKITRRCIMGAPDFVMEILSESTRSKDMYLKLRKYGAAGVREYWMADIERRKVVVYYFEKDSRPAIYGMREKIPVGIFGGGLQIDFRMVEKALEDIGQ